MHTVLKLFRNFRNSEAYNPRHAVSSDIMHYAFYIMHCIDIANC